MNKTFFYPFILFLILAISTFLFGFFTNFTESSFIFLRSITAFQYTVFLAFVFGLLTFKDRIEIKLTLNKKELYIGLGFFFAMVSLFEVFVNFFLWFSLLTISGGTSQINDIRAVLPTNHALLPLQAYLNTTQIQTSGLYPPNLNVASKGWFVMFFAAVYWIYFVARLKLGRTEELR